MDSAPLARVFLTIDAELVGAAICSTYCLLNSAEFFVP
jgi:hypothetical protein